MHPTKTNARIALVIAVLAIAVFAQVVTHQFINYDDGLFVFDNDHVKHGLTAGSLRWAWTSAEIGYSPLTWMSHMTDVAAFGMNAGGHLATSLLLHIVSSCLLFFALTRMTAAPGRSAFVAALFAIHPMHVESVAWVSERKDTLSTLFGVIALLLYARPRTVRRDIAVAIAFAASLLAKQMLVTLPFLLLLLDYWPLRRPLKIVEKLPLFLIATGGIVLAITGQHNLNAVQSTAVLPLSFRVENALIAYAKYIGKLIWPVDLAPIYPLATPTFGAAGLALLLLAAVTFAAWTVRKRAPYVLVGWLWFVGTLVPVIGIVQIGAASMADRYTYFPSIGLLIAIVWGAADILTARIAAIAGAIVTAIFAIDAFVQTGYWKNTDTLFTHTLAVTGPNPIAEYVLGQSLQSDDPDRAIPHLRRAIDLTEAALRATPDSPKPDLYAQSHVGIGTALLTKAKSVSDAGQKQKLIVDAAGEYEAALRIDPTAGNAERNLALARRLAAEGSGAAQRDVDRLIDAGVAFAQQKSFDQAIAEFRKAVSADPSSLEAHVYLGIGLAEAKQNAEAADELRKAQQIDAARANRFVTGILRLPKNDTNLDRLLQQLGTP
jgi:hypothetical protein